MLSIMISGHPREYLYTWYIIGQLFWALVPGIFKRKKKTVAGLWRRFL